MESTKMGATTPQGEEWCGIPAPTGGAAGLFYRSGHDGNLVHVCAGLMLNLDEMEPYTLKTLLTHELAHAIDPASDIWNKHEAAFPGLKECIQGKDPKVIGDGQYVESFADLAGAEVSPT